jgi:Ni,Fe-hydrogenase maturation factor
MGAHLPGEVLIVGVEAQSVYDFSEILSPPVAAAVPVAARLVLELLEEKPHGLP